MTPEEQIKHKFTYHPPVGDQVQSYERIRNKAMELALLISAECPISQEKEQALHYVELASMWAIAAKARWDSHPPEMRSLVEKFEQELARQMRQQPPSSTQDGVL